MAEASLRGRALKASVAEILGLAGSMLLRLVSTLVLSRLLFPEAFGLAALVSTVAYGLLMISDMGLLQSVVQNERGDDPVFLDTVWSLQMVRGGGLWLAACLMAWPLSQVYKQPELMWMLPVGCFALVVNGLASTSVLTLRRQMASSVLVKIDLAAQVAGLLVVFAWAYWYPSAWAIVAGGLTSSVYKTVASYRLANARRNRPAWDLQSRREIVGFGKWIFGASALDYVGRHGDRLLIGHYLGVAVLGVYSIAVLLAEALQAAVGRVSNSVLFPLLSQVNRDDPQRLSEYFYRVRLRLDAFGLIPVGVVAMMAQTVVDVLYDPRYVEAGWMLQVICLRIAIGTVAVPIQTCLFSSGNTRVGIYQNLSRMLCVVIGVPVGWALGGVHGVVWAAAASELPSLLILWFAFHRQGLLRVRREALALLFACAGLAAGWALDHAFHAVAGRLGWSF